MSGGGGGNSNGQGGTFNPSQTGALFGTKLNEYLTGNPPVFDKSMFAEPGADTLKGQAMIRGAANSLHSGGGLGRAYSYTDNLIQGGGFAPGMGGDINKLDTIGNQYGAMADGAADPSLIEGTYGNIQRSLRQPSAAETTYGGIQKSLAGPSYAETGFRSMSGVPGTSLTEERFGGDQYGLTSPAYQKLRAKLADDVTTNNLSAFNADGMFGSDANRESLAEGLGTALAGADMEQMQYGDALERGDVQAIEAARQRGLDNRTRALGAADAARLDQLGARMGAVGAGDTARLNQLGARMGALGAEDASAANRFTRRMSALGGEQGAATGAYGMRQGGINNALTAAGSLGSRFADMLLPADAIRGVGSEVDATGQGRLLGEADQFDRTKNAGYNRFAELLGLFGGSQGLPGMTEKVPFWQQLLGYVGQNAGNAIGAYAR